MKKRFVFCSLLVFTVQAAAHQPNCENVGTRLNELVSADQQVRREWSLLEQNSKTTTAERDALQQR